MFPYTTYVLDVEMFAVAGKRKADHIKKLHDGFKDGTLQKKKRKLLRKCSH
jgi:hypothetical protein